MAARAGTPVVDLTRICGAMTMMLATWAPCDQVERRTGDDTAAGAAFRGRGGAYFLGVNATKRSVTINLAAERARIFCWTDREGRVLMTTLTRPLEKWGFGDAWFERTLQGRALLDHRLRLERP